MKSFKRVIATALAGLSLTLSPALIQAQSFFTDNNVEYELVSPEKALNKAAWGEFNTKYGSPNVSLDAATATPKYIVGGSIKIGNGEIITKENVEKLVKQFIDDNASSFKFNSSNLRIVQKDNVNNRFYLTFVQYYNGVKVLNSRVSLTVFENGAVPSIKIAYFPQIGIATTASVSFTSAAQSVGVIANDNKNKVDMTLSSEQPCVLPIRTESGFIYKLVYPVSVQCGEISQNALYYVDAHSLETVEKKRLVNDEKTTSTVKAYVKQNNPFDTLSIVNIPHLKFNLGSSINYTGLDGSLETPVSATSPINLGLTGKWCRVITKQKDSASLNGNIIPGKDNLFIFDSTNSHIYERMVYYHFNRVKDFHQKMDTTLKCLDVQFRLQLEYFQSNYYVDPNAYSSGSTIAFVDLHNTGYRMAETPEILYHEYGHSVNSLFYGSKGFGFASDAANEGIADVTAAMITGNSKCGIGYKTNSPNDYIRDLKNNFRYPESTTGESHDDGRILSGAFWDLGLVTSLETMGKLMHFARYQLPNDPNTGLAFFDWLIAVLVADDDDGNLDNGTPHFMEIVKSFDKHGIGFQIIYPDFIKHQPISNWKDTTKSINVDFQVVTAKYAFLHSDSAVVTYRIKPLSGMAKSWNKISAKKNSYGDYTALIPPQSPGTIVEYYIAVYDTFFTSASTLYLNQSKKEPFAFMVGYKTNILENFESSNWVIGDTGDNGTNAIKWVLDSPKGINTAQLGYLRPDKDYSATGDKCFISGNSSVSAGSGFYDVYNQFPNGTISLVSNYYDLSGLNAPIIQFKYFFGAYTFVGTPTLSVYMNTDSNKTWKLIKDLTSTDRWNNKFFRVKDYYSSTVNKAKFKFVYRVSLFNTKYPYGLGSALIDDFEVLSADVISDVNSNEVSADVNAYVFPNPTEGTMNIQAYSESANPTLSIFNSLGVKVYENVLPVSASGYINATINLNSLNGVSLTSGAYYYNLQAGEKSFRGSIIKN